MLRFGANGRTSARAHLSVLLVVCLLVTLLPVASAVGAEEPRESGQHAIDRVVVKFKSGTVAAGQRAALSKVRGRAVSTAPRTGVTVVSLPKGTDVIGAVERLDADPRVEFAEPDYVVRAALVPNDPDFDTDWGATAISATGAWSVTTGSRGIVVAVLDSGVDAAHSEFAGRIVPGYDFVNSDRDPTDDNGHGTMVAGILGATGDNGIGGAGVDWSAAIMPIKVIDAAGLGYASTVAAGLVWAADNGARVVNMSLGSLWNSEALAEAVAYASAKGTVMVAAAGNDGGRSLRFPAAYPEVISVGSVGRSGGRSGFSNHGADLDVVAPGEDVRSTAMGGGYAEISGTSASAPRVAGIATLLRAANPSLEATAVKRILRETATDLGAEGRDCSYGSGRVDAAAALLSEAAAPADPPDGAVPLVRITSPAEGERTPRSLRVRACASDDVGVTRVQLLVNGRIAAEGTSPGKCLRWRVKGLPAGRYVLKIIAYDAAGNAGESESVAVALVRPPRYRIR